MIVQIKIATKEYPFRLTMWRLEELLRSKGYSFQAVGAYLAESPVDAMCSIVALGLTIGSSKSSKPVKYTAEDIDDMIGMDYDAFGEVAAFVGEYLGVKQQDEDQQEADVVESEKK